MVERVRQIIREHGRLPADLDKLDDEADLYQAGMTSHASVNVMLALEAAFDVEFPDAHAEAERVPERPSIRRRTRARSGVAA